VEHLNPETLQRRPSVLTPARVTATKPAVPLVPQPSDALLKELQKKLALRAQDFEQFEIRVKSGEIKFETLRALQPRVQSGQVTKENFKNILEGIIGQQVAARRQQ
jgi:hypothetical protein